VKEKDGGGSSSHVVSANREKFDYPSLQITTFFSAVKTEIGGFYKFCCAEFKNAFRFAVSCLVNSQ
jgi:hypothetical protein